MSPCSRRRAAALPLLALSGCSSRSVPQPAPAPAWRPEFDREILLRAIAANGERYDEKEHMLASIVSAGYRYHTRLRDTRAHPTRDSLDYALLLLEAGAPPHLQRASLILSRLLPLQDAQPASPCFGLWGYFLEEPPAKMNPPDWNWAAFLAAPLLAIEFRHGEKLDSTVRLQVRQAIARAALFIRRRDASSGLALDASSLAIQSAFVTIAAGELAGDPSLTAYARDLALRIAHHIDQSGSFSEYNAPASARLALTTLARYRMFVQDEPSRARMARIERRLWEHLAAHFDPARAQFAGPMSRCLANDFGAPLWLEKALDAQLGIASPGSSTPADAETALHSYRCPPDLAPSFLAPTPNRQHSELFSLAPAPDSSVPIQGVTWFSRDFSLGSVNHGDFSHQRRPLLAYFGDRSRPARTVLLRVVKDGYDFSSALLFSVQSGPRIAALVNFRNPGGDRHPSLDPIRNGAFRCGRLFLELRVEGLDPGYRLARQEDSFTLSSATLCLGFRLCGGAFGAHTPALALSQAPRNLTLTLDFKPLPTPPRVAWKDIPRAWAAFALQLGDASQPVPPPAATALARDAAVEISFDDLWLRGAASVAPIHRQLAVFDSRVAGRTPAVVRLNEAQLA